MIYYLRCTFLIKDVHSLLKVYVLKESGNGG